MTAVLYQWGMVTVAYCNSCVGQNSGDLDKSKLQWYSKSSCCNGLSIVAYFIVIERDISFCCYPECDGKEANPTYLHMPYINCQRLYLMLRDIFNFKEPIMNNGCCMGL